MSEMNLILFIINLAMIAFIGVYLAILPQLTRKALLFGVRVPESVQDSAEAKGLKRNYIATVMAGSGLILLLAVLQYLLWPDLSLLACLYFPLILIAVQFAAFIPGWKKARKFKEEKGWHIPDSSAAETRTAVQREKLLGVPWFWYGIGAALCLLMVIWSLAVYPSLPDQIPTHWDFQMQPDDWSQKSVMTVLLMPLITLGLILLMAVVNISIFKMKLQISTENPALSFAQHRMYRKMMSHSLGFMTVCLALLFLFLQLMTINVIASSSSLMTILMLVFVLLSIIPLLYVSIKAGQSGNKLKPEVTADDQLALDGSVQEIRIRHPGRGDDRFWKLGMFYYNPEDPALLVEDRFGGNGGLNYARPAAKLLMGLLAVFVIAVYAVTTVLFTQYF